MDKFLSTVIISLFVTGILLGQRKVEEEIPMGNASKVKLEFGYADVEISTWNGSQVVINGTASINEGENDDSFVLETGHSGDLLSVKTYIKDIDQLPRIITVMKDGKKYRFRKQGKDKKAVYQTIKEELGDGLLPILVGRSRNRYQAANKNTGKQPDPHRIGIRRHRDRQNDVQSAGSQYLRPHHCSIEPTDH